MNSSCRPRPPGRAFWLTFFLVTAGFAQLFAQTAPIALTDSISTAEDQAILIPVLQNDSDVDNDLDSASLQILIPPVHGLALVEGAAPYRIDYTPDANYFGLDSFLYEICDTTLLCAQAWVIIEVLSVNDPPLILNDTLLMNQATIGRIDVLANDSDPLDPDGYLDTATLQIAIVPLHGAAFFDLAEVVYTPLPAFFGLDSLAYRVCDAGPPGPVFCDTGWVLIEVLAGSPVALNDSLTLNEDESLLIFPTLNDSDPQGNIRASSLALLSGPFQGSALLDTLAASLLYTPDAHYFGSDSMLYQVCDSTLLCDSAWVLMSILPVNDPPLILPDSAEVGAGLSVLIDVLANDSDPFDPDGGIDAASLSLLSAPTLGLAALDTDLLVFEYSAFAGSTGLDSFSYRVCDNGVPLPVLCDTGWVYVEVFEAAPSALNDSASLNEDESISIAVLANDSDPQNNIDINSLVILEAPLNGSASVGPMPGEISYAPLEDFYGLDSMRYRICDLTALCDSATVFLEILPVNDAPNIQNDTVSLDEDSSLEIFVLANDDDARDPEGGLDSTSLSVTLAPLHGSAVVNVLSGSVLYTPDPDYFGPDSFQYSVCDLGFPLPALCGSATVIISVLPVNDAPVALPDTAFTDEDVAVGIFVLLNDTDVEDGVLDPAGLSLFEAPLNGTALVNTTSGEIVYTPATDYYGTDRFVYQICDSEAACDTASVYVNIAPINDPPLAVADFAVTDEDVPVQINVLANDNDDRDAEGGLDTASLTFTILPLNGVLSPFGPGVVTYTPNADYFGPDSFRYRICDVGFPLPARCAQAWVRITVNSVNDLPVAMPDTAFTDEDIAVGTFVLLNDTDVEDGVLDPAGLSLFEAPLDGTALVNTTSGEIVYTPATDYYGTDRYVYQICDSDGGCDTASVYVNIAPINDPPVALPDVAVTDEDIPVQIDVLANDNDDRDPEGGLNPASLTFPILPQHGVLSPFAPGIVTYTPNADYFGPDSFRYRICDLGFPLPALCAQAWVRITVNSVNDLPVAMPDTAFTDEDVAVGTFVLLNDTDVEDGVLDPAGLSLFEAPLNGTALVNTTSGEIVYTPATDYYGTDRYVYQICDSDGGCDTASVYVNIAPINDAPVALPDVAVTDEDVPVQINVLANDNDDRDPEGGLDSASLSFPIMPMHGVLSPFAPGIVTYTPNADYFGPDSFRYRICDLGFPLPALCAQAWVRITVNSVNDLPVAMPDTAFTDEDVAVGTFVLLNDTDVEDGVLDPAGLSLFEAPLNGTALVNVISGEIVYTPSLDYYGADRYVYQICDSDGGCDTASVYVNIAPINDPPVAVDDVGITAEDVPVIIPVLANDNDDRDPEGGLDTASLSVITAPVNGLLSIALDGLITYTSFEDYFGVDSFQYRICDLGFPLPALCDSAWVRISISAVNDPPVINPDTVSGLEDETLLIDVLANDFDVEDGSPLPGTVSIIIPPSNGFASVNLITGIITYDPLPNYHGPDALTYQACDSEGLCGSALVSITILPVNDPPVALDDFKAGLEDEIMIINVLANDSDPFDPGGGLDPASVINISGPFNGSVVFSPLTGQATYTPNEHYYGVDSFRYRVCDTGEPLPPLCDVASVFLLIAPVNDAPIALDDFDVTAENTAVITNVLANDSDPFDPEGGIDPTSVTIVSPPLFGTAIPNAISGQVTYTPIPGFVGVDSYAYRVCDVGHPLPPLCDQATVVILVSNEAPNAVDDLVSTLEDVPLLIDVLANDTDPQNNIDSSSVTVVVPPINGTALPVGLLGEILYTPNDHYNGSDVFTYRVCDEDGFCDQAQVFITIEAVNDPPLIVNDIVMTDEDTPVTVVVIANDSDPFDPGSGIDPSTLSILVPPVNGSVVLDLITGSVTYTPSPDFFGVDFFIYEVCDLGIPLPALCGSASVLITINPVNDPPVAVDDFVTTLEDNAVVVDVLANDFDVEDETLDPASVAVLSPPVNGSTLVNSLTGEITYTPNLHFNGSDLFSYTACDSEGACDQASVFITVLPVNDPPVLGDDVATTLEDVAVEIDVLANDSDIHDPGGEIDPGTLSIVAAPSHGSISIDLITGMVTYTPALNYYGTDAFSYRVCDTGVPLPPECAEAEVSITIDPVNDAPVVVDDFASTPEETPVVVNVLINDHDDADPEGGLDLNSLIIISGPSNGVAAVLPSTGLISYVPNAGFAGTDNLVYEICDTGFPLPALCGQAELTIVVSNESPTANDDMATLDEDEFVVVDVLANDTDPQDNIDPTSVSIITPPSHGVAVVDALTGAITYTPSAHYHGTDFLVYRVCDLTDYCDQARVDLIINPVNDPPLILNDNDETLEDTPVSTPVLDNDSDPFDFPFSDIDPSTIGIVIGPSNGSVVADPVSGLITYTPDPDYFGADSYIYSVCDDGFPLPALCGQALVVINILPVDDPVIAVDDVATTTIGTPIDIAVLANDIDPDGDIDPSSVTVIVPAMHGTAVPLESGAVRYSPEFGFFGLDSFFYRVCDLPGNCDSARVLITVVAAPPLAVNDTVSTFEATEITIDILANDQAGTAGLDLESVQILQDAGNGLSTLDPETALLTYWPDLEFCGTDSLLYEVCDLQGLCDSAWVFVVVTCIDLVAVDDVAQTGFESPVVVNVLGNDSPNADPNCLQIDAEPANGSAVVLEIGQILYTPDPGFSGTDCFRYSVCDTTESVFDQAQVCIEVLPEVQLQVPGAFSPNGDGYNDFLVIPAIQQYPQNELIIFNRWENKVFQARGYDNTWDGRNQGNGEPLPDGTYFFLLRLNPDDADARVLSGSINIIR